MLKIKEAAIVLAAGLTLTSVAVGQTKKTVTFGDVDSEKAHAVSAESAEIVRDAYPSHWVMSVRSSAFQEGHEPWRAIDGDDATTWQTVGKPPLPMARGQWIELELNRAMSMKSIQVRWTGDQPYDFKIYDKPFSDFRRLLMEGRSAEKAGEMETYKLPAPAQTRAIRIEFAVDGESRPQGIAEVRIEGVAWPEGYPSAVYKDAPVQVVHRPYYVEFQRFMTWPVFNLKRPLADGVVGRRIESLDSFEGGHIDFDIGVEPEQANLITLKLWESEAGHMTERGNCIILQPLIEDPVHNGRWFLPAFVTEALSTQQEWYGTRPTPGRWMFATYRLPTEITAGKQSIRLRLQGVGNVRRDHPMRASAPPVYSVTSHTDFIGQDVKLQD